MGLIAEIHRDLEKGALQLLVEYRERLLHEAVKLCGDASQAEELVFRTIERVLQKSETYRSDDNLFGWMKTILTNLYRDDLKHPENRLARAVPPEELESLAGLDFSAEERILRNSDGEAVREALGRIDPEHRRLLQMRFYEEMTLEEISAYLKCPVGTVWRRMQLALRFLSGKLNAGVRAGRPMAILAALMLAGSLFGAVTWGVVEAVSAVGSLGSEVALESEEPEAALGSEGTLGSLESEGTLGSAADPVDPNPDPIVPKSFASTAQTVSSPLSATGADTTGAATLSTREEKAMNLSAIKQKARVFAAGTLMTMGVAASAQAAVEPLAVWDGFKIPVRGGIALSYDASCALDSETGALTIGTDGISIPYGSFASTTFTIFAEVSDCPSSSSGVTLLRGYFTGFKTGLSMVATDSGIEQRWGNEVYSSGETVLDGGRHTIALSYNVGVNTGAEAASYVDGQRASVLGQYMSAQNIDEFHVGKSMSGGPAAAMGMKVYRIALYREFMTANEVAAFKWPEGGVRPFALWNGFNDLNSGSYVIARDPSSTVDEETGVLTVGSTGGLVFNYSGFNRNCYTIIADISDCPAVDGGVSVLSGLLTSDYGLSTIVTPSTIEQRWHDGRVFGSGDVALGSGRHAIALVYFGSRASSEATTYVDGTPVATYPSYLTDGIIQKLKIGTKSSASSVATATGLKIHRLALFDETLTGDEIAAFDWEDRSTTVVSAVLKFCSEKRAFFNLSLSELELGSGSAEISYAIATEQGEFSDWTVVESNAGKGWGQTLSIDGLQRATGYRLRVRAVDNQGTETVSEDVAFTTKEAPLVINVAEGDSLNNAYSEIVASDFGEGTVLIADGRYVLDADTTFAVRDVNVSFIGASGDPSKVVVSASQVSQLNQTEKGRRAFVSIAPVEFRHMTLTGGHAFDSRTAGHGMVAQLTDGRLMNCIITGNSGGSALWVTGTAVVENCLIVSNDCLSSVVELPNNDAYPGQHALVNCTVVGNDSDVYGISTVSGGLVINCAEFGVKSQEGTSCPPANYINCAGDHAFDGAPGWVETEKELAIDAAGRPVSGGSLRKKGNAALYGTWAIGTTDLGGKPRFVAPNRIDIGCYAVPHGGTYILIR